jgi:hypothetical protein
VYPHRSRVGHDLRAAVDPPADHQDPLSHADRFLNVVRHDDGGEIGFARQAAHEVLQVFAGGGVQGGKGFVHQKDVRVEGHGAGDGRALPLTPGDLGRIFVGQIGDIQARQPIGDFLVGHRRVDGGIIRAVPPVRAIEAADLETQGHIVPDRGPGQKAMVLQHEPVAGTRPGQRQAIDAHPP